MDPIAAVDLSVAADPIEAVDPNAVGDHYAEVARTAAQNAVVADPNAAGDRDGEAVHTAVPNVVAAGLTAVVAQIVEAVPNAAAAVQSAAVDRFSAVLRNVAPALKVVPNVATNAVQIFPMAQHDLAVLVVQADPQARNVGFRNGVVDSQADANSLSVDDCEKVCQHRHLVALVD